LVSIGVPKVPVHEARLLNKNLFPYFPFYV
jgi:hypothetical protein